MHLTASKRPGYSCSHWLIAFFADTSSSCGKHVDMQAAEHLFDQVVVPSLVRVSIGLASGPLQLSLQDIWGRGWKEPTVLICFLMPLISIVTSHKLEQTSQIGRRWQLLFQHRAQVLYEWWWYAVCGVHLDGNGGGLAYIYIYCSAPIMPNSHYLSVANNCYLFSQQAGDTSWDWGWFTTGCLLRRIYWGTGICWCLLLVDLPLVVQAVWS